MMYRIVRVPGDGNCLFSAIALGYHIAVGNVSPAFPYIESKLWRKIAAFYRDVAVSAACTFPNRADSPLHFMTNEDRASYCTDMRRNGFFGGEMEIAALSKALRIPIIVSDAITMRTISEYPHRWASNARYNKLPPIRLLYDRNRLHYDLIVAVPR